MLQSSAEAQLTLLIDTANEEYTWTGSDTGGTEFVGLFHRIQWATAPTTGTMFSVATGMDAAGAIDFATESVNVFSDGGFRARYDTAVGIGDLTFTGSGVPQSYAGATSAEKNALASLIGTQAPLTDGIGYSPITFAAVPEPRDYAILTGFALLLFTVTRKIRASRSQS